MKTKQTKEQTAACKKAYYIAHKVELAAKRKIYLEAHRTELVAYYKAYQKTHKAERAAFNKAYRIKHPNKAKEAKWKRKEIVNKQGKPFLFADYERLVKKQNGLCAICHNPPNGKSTNGIDNSAVLSMDHDHRTGVVRALLCSTCNTGIGLLKDNSALLRSAADYLDKHK